ncbi:MAG: 16S rRNA (cytidine(1402)-2'-O)-methyltransferase [Arcanobacterium sp.]|nr:16S rRNA (cytidine(1402)-2'-O)-methyltransferase [Arcanobacterium sp.]
MIILAATPLGNDGDASLRLRQAIESADLIAAEDTRRLRNLCSRLDLHPTAKIIAFHDHNEAQLAPELVAQASLGAQIVVVSDAGMPSVSDPGYRLANLAQEQQVPITVIPGPSAVLTALAISGLATNRFSFEGFAPRKTGEQLQIFGSLADDERTLIFFESPRRLAATLQTMAATFGDEREAAVCRELTKTYEEVKRGSLAELSVWAQTREILGEIVIVVSGANPRMVDAVAAFLPEVVELVELGVRAKAAAAHVAKREGLRANELYRKYLEHSAGSGNKY